MPTLEPLIIAVDGPAASGKGLLARRLATHYALNHLETGLLYRAVGLRMLRAGDDPADEPSAAEAARSVVSADLEGPDLRDEAVSQAASVVAAYGAVREALLAFQRRFAATPPGAVLDGRDIGTVVCPGAQAKIYLDASLAVRADRRARELRSRGVESIESRVLKDMKARDTRDSSRAAAPLTPADGACRIDTSDLSPDQVFERAVSYVDSRLARLGMTPPSPR